MEKVFKELTRNDTGETNSHQSGITIPKKVANTAIFPKLGTKELNPRNDIFFFDEEGNRWKFQYIYYNDVYFGKPKEKAHDEHRLTCVKEYLRANGVISGDTIWFGIDENGIRKIGIIKKDIPIVEHEKIVLKIGQGWKYIKI